MAEYRQVHSDQLADAVQLWVDVFGVERRFFQSLLDVEDPEDFSVGAFEGGQLVSSVHVFTRWFRDRNGTPLKVGGIGSVCTLPQHRGVGHSSKLLEMAIEGMNERECVWSGLGTGVNDHYARHGWRTLSTPTFAGTLRGGQNSVGLRPSEVTPALLKAMKEVHDEYSVSVPLSNERSLTMWQSAVSYRISGPLDEVFTHYDGERLVAYLVTRNHGTEIHLVEGASRKDTHSELQNLVRQRLASASCSRILKVRCLLPEESEAFAAFKSGCLKIWPGEGRGWMARPIAGRITWPVLGAMHADPRGQRSDLDHF